VSGLSDIELDSTLLALAAAGEHGAQAEIYRRLAGPAFALTRRLVPDRAAAEDLFQEGLLQVFARLGQFRGEAPFGAWVRQILVRGCLMYLRSPWQRARLALQAGDDECGPGIPGLTVSASNTSTDDHIDLARAFGQLAPVTRAVLWLHDVEGLTHEEIATGMGRSPSFSKSQVARGHERLRGLLSSEEEIPCATPRSTLVP
jgi:RNA polymerase sigma-70 factor (ECF subfamily)